jgi:thiamine biosynthesis lipoprotein
MHEAARIARKLSALRQLGLERVDCVPVTTQALRIDRKTHKVTRTKLAMGTLVSVSALARSQQRAEEAIGRALEEMDRLIAVFSRYESGSALSQLNHAGRLDSAPPELAHVISRSQQFHEVTRGTFDISVAPVIDLFRDRLDGTTPERGEVREALELVGIEHLEVSQRQIRFRRSGMRVTLDGIAKGYIVDCMARELERHRIGRYLIDAGGDIRAAGTKERKLPWTVAVQDPEKAGRFPDTIHPSGGAVATSGSYEIYFDRDERFHHIVNSTSGVSPHLTRSASVVAPTTMAADALATGLFVMEPKAGIAFVDALPGCECLLIERDGTQRRTGGWRSAPCVNGEEAEA